MASKKTPKQAAPAKQTENLQIILAVSMVLFIIIIMMYALGFISAGAVVPILVIFFIVYEMYFLWRVTMIERLLKKCRLER